MKINVSNANRIINIILILILVAAGVSYFFLNEAQRIVVVAGVVLGVLNLLGLKYFFNKNTGSRKR